jgi:CheY-like chemotaxis protein
MTATDSPAARPHPSHRVLLVDDDTQFTALLKQHLVNKREPSWIVHTAENYSEALDCLKINTVDLVVLDIQMPVMDGLQFLTMLKRSRPALPVVVLSGVVTPQNRDYALQHGAALILDKIDLATGFERLYPALEATAEAPPVEGFKGMVRQVGLMELLQLECLGRKSSILEIKASDTEGRIYISEGSIIHAETGGILGEKALARLYGLKGGEFRLAPFTQPSRQTIDGQWEALLMEAAQTSDEQAGEAAEQGTATAESDTRLEAAQQGGGDRHIEEIVLCSSSNDILYQWMSPHAERRVVLLDWLLTKSAGMGKLLPALGRADRLEIREPRSRVICLLQPERKMFVRLSMTPP